MREGRPEEEEGKRKERERERGRKRSIKQEMTSAKAKKKSGRGNLQKERGREPMKTRKAEMVRAKAFCFPPFSVPVISFLLKWKANRRGRRQVKRNPRRLGKEESTFLFPIIFLPLSLAALLFYHLFSFVIPCRRLWKKVGKEEERGGRERDSEREKERKRETNRGRKGVFLFPSVLVILFIEREKTKTTRIKTKQTRSCRALTVHFHASSFVVSGLFRLGKGWTRRHQRKATRQKWLVSVGGRKGVGGVA